MEELFKFSVAPWELFVRASAVYWFLFIVFRFVMHRDVGALGLADVLVLVLIADASQNAMSGEYKTISDGFVVVTTIVGWNYLLDWAAYRYEFMRRFAEPPPVLLVNRGRVLQRNLRKELLSTEDLMSKLREHGVDKLAQVKSARMEGDGTVTVIRYDGEDEDPPRKTPEI